MNLKHLVVACALITAVATPASALTLTNNDDKTYEVTVTVGEGDASVTRHSLAKGQTLQDICNEGCTVRLDNDVEWEFEGNESVTITDGEFAIND